MNFWREQVIQPALEQDLRDAISERLAILERDPSDARAHFALAMLRHFQGDYDAARTLFARAIVLDDEYAAPHVGLGRIDIVQGRYGEAWHHAQEAARLGDRSLLEQMERYPNLYDRGPRD